MFVTDGLSGLEELGCGSAHLSFVTLNESLQRLLRDAVSYDSSGCDLASTPHQLVL